MGYVEANNSEFSEQGVMNVYMEQAVLHSTLPDSDREDVLKFMEMRYKSSENTQFLQEYILHADVEVYQQEMLESAPDNKKVTRLEGNFAQYLGVLYSPPCIPGIPGEWKFSRGAC